MGLRQAYIDFIDSAIETVTGKAMLELGNQLIHEPLVGSKHRTGKEYWLSRGVARHVSIDKNGLDGAQVYDLETPIRDYYSEFDIVTDISVSCYMKNCEQCFLNMHSFCEIGGMLIHIIPSIGSNWNCIWKAGAGMIEGVIASLHGEIEKAAMIDGLHGDLLCYAWRKTR